MVVCLALVIVLVPVNPVMVVERSNDGEVLVDPDQEGRQQGGHGHQGGARCQKAAECWKKQEFYTPWFWKQNFNKSKTNSKFSPGLGSMTLKVESAKERGVRRRPINRLPAARFTTNLGINTVTIDHRLGWMDGSLGGVRYGAPTILKSHVKLDYLLSLVLCEDWYGLCQTDRRELWLCEGGLRKGHLLLSVLNPRRRQKSTMRRELSTEPRMKARQVRSSSRMAVPCHMRRRICYIAYLSVMIWVQYLTKGIVGAATAIGSTISDEFSHSVIWKRE